MKVQTMNWQLVGKGDVIVLNVPGEPPISVAISDVSFVHAIEQLIDQAKRHPTSMLRCLRVERER